MTSNNNNIPCTSQILKPQQAEQRSRLPMGSAGASNLRRFVADAVAARRAGSMNQQQRPWSERAERVRRSMLGPLLDPTNDDDDDDEAAAEPPLFFAGAGAGAGAGMNRPWSQQADRVRGRMFASILGEEENNEDEEKEEENNEEKEEEEKEEAGPVLSSAHDPRLPCPSQKGKEEEPRGGSGGTRPSDDDPAENEDRPSDDDAHHDNEAAAIVQPACSNNNNNNKNNKRRRKSPSASVSKKHVNDDPVDEIQKLKDLLQEERRLRIKKEREISKLRKVIKDMVRKGQDGLQEK